MGECGCYLEFHRCSEHEGDVILALDAMSADFVRRATEDFPIHTSADRTHKTLVLRALSAEREGRNQE